MPNEPLALPELLAGLPETADYDAVLAAIMATAGGRKFLSEFAERNRNTDTAMVVGAIARIEAALRGDAAPPASSGPGDLIEIAGALERIAAALAAGTTRASGVAAAIERMQDIAFMLHERPLEPTLRDSFDAAVRELSAAARSDADPGAAELMQALTNRVREMIEARMSHRPAAELFAAPADDGGALAQAVAALAESLPTVAETSEAAAVPAATAEKPEQTPPDEGPPAPPPPAAAQIAGTAAAIAAPVEEAAAVPAEAPGPQAAETSVVAVEDATAAAQAAPETLDSQAILTEAFADDHFAGTAVASEPPAGDVQPAVQVAETQAPREEPPSAEPASEVAPPAQEFAAEPVAGPEEDPADLFEPPPEPAADASPPPPHIVPPPPARAIPRPPLSDPLAAVRDLSEEELLALFS